MRTIFVCCALIGIKSADGMLVLAAKKAVGTTNALLYEFPGGKIEHRESPQHAIVREMAEEMACAVTPVRLLPVVPRVENNRRIELMPIVCSLQSGLPLPLEHESLGFFTPHTLRELPWAPADRQIVEFLPRSAAGMTHFFS